MFYFSEKAFYHVIAKAVPRVRVARTLSISDRKGVVKRDQYYAWLLTVTAFVHLVTYINKIIIVFREYCFRLVAISITLAV